MSRRHVIAVGVAVLGMLLALLPPLWVRSTGDDLYLGLEPLDPQSLFRGNYVNLRFDAEDDVAGSRRNNEAVFVVFDDARPATLLRVSSTAPDLAPNERCLRAQQRYSRLEFPALDQYFVTAERGRELERQLDDLVAVIKTTDSCRSVLVDLEPTDQG